MTRMCEGCGAHIFDPQEPCPACGRPWPLKSLKPEKKHRLIHRVFGYVLGFLVIWVVVAALIVINIGPPPKSEDVVLLVIGSGALAGFVVICGRLGINKVRASRRRKRFLRKSQADAAGKRSPDR